MHQMTLFSDLKQTQIGDIVTSKITGQQIRVKKMNETFIVGTLVDFQPYPLSHPLRCYDGAAILSYKNMIQI